METLTKKYLFVIRIANIKYLEVRISMKCMKNNTHIVCNDSVWIRLVRSYITFT
jgi:hypothetical protein